ncbi:hypothetical protein PHMEG_00028115 [Phytophthora megakarya]|uniref:Uncharacterized protein n=1 Tax=Phytophthora megakarya TaxID=4795 RepID=A0A225V6R0_9STRA|nr:hypothetical protein PHMEG_00028115 [Phytophthora megakarya]
MSVPLFSPVVAPRISSTSHSALINWKKARAEYEESVKARSKGDKELYDRLFESVKSTFDDKLLDALCTYRWNVTKEDVTDDRIMTEIDAIIKSVKNHTLPDIDQRFAKELRFDMKETDVHERVLKYFMSCNQIIDDHGLKTCFEGDNGLKEKCKLLIESLAPNELKTDVKNAIRFQIPVARSDEKKLHDLILEKTLEQDRDFRRRKRSRYDEKFTKPDKTQRVQGKPRAKDQRGRPQRGANAEHDSRRSAADRVAKPAADEKKPAAPRDGCLKCGGPHYISSCSAATNEEKKELPKKFHRPRPEKSRMKRIKERLGGINRVMLNDVLELQYCADTGSDRCLISRTNYNELIRRDARVTCIQLDAPVVGKAVGGHEVQSHASIDIRLQLHTAVGPVEPAQPVTCLIIDHDDDEFIVGNDVLVSLGIDVDRQLEQLAGKNRNLEADPFESEEEFRPGHLNDEAIRDGIEKLLTSALKNGFPTESLDELRRITTKHDIWRVVLCDDPPAKVPPYKIRLKPDAKPFRCRARQYAPLQTKFLHEFNQTLVDLGWVYKNPSSRWACAALPVRKPKSDEFRQAVD